MRSVVATTMILVLGVVQTGLAGMCFCDATRPAGATAAAEEHHCCEGAEAKKASTESEAEPVANIHAPCKRGCCERPRLDDVRDRLSQADPLDPPVEHPLAAPPSTITQRTVASWQPIGDVRKRGPPPDPLARRLAHLQIWRC